MLEVNKVYRLQKGATVLQFDSFAHEQIVEMNRILTEFLTAKKIDISSFAGTPSPEDEIALIDELCDSELFHDTDLEKEAIKISNSSMVRIEEECPVVFVEHLPGNVTDSVILMGGKLFQCRTEELIDVNALAVTV